MPTLQEKIQRLGDAKELVASLVAAGVDLKSEQAIPAELELIHAVDDLAQEFGHKLLKPLE